MKLARKAGATSQIFQVFIRDSSSTTGAGLTGLAFNTASLVAYYHRDTDTTATAITLVTMTVGTFTSSGFKEIDATNMPGWYQFCPPNAALAAGAATVAFHLKGATNMAPLPIEVDLDAQVDVTSWNGTAVSSPATAGIPDVNVKNINNVSAASVTTISANQGTTQPVNFTGTGAAADVKVDVDTIKTNPVVNAGTVTFPTTATLASTTNITEGTVTTATNVTTVNGLAADTITATALAVTAVTKIADGLLDRDMSTGTDSGSPTVRTPRQAFRVLRNKVTSAGGTLTVYKEDDTTTTWTAAETTDAAALPITGIDPA